MYELSLTISGLCLVSINGQSGDSHAIGARAEVPTVEGHETQLTFRRLDLEQYGDVMTKLRAQNRKLRRFFGPDGTDLLALSLGVGQGRFLYPDDDGDTPQGLDMSWLPKPPRPGPIAEDMMDWLITIEDLGIEVKKDPGTQIVLPRGAMGAKNLYRSNGKFAIFEAKPTSRSTALADDIEIRGKQATQAPFRFLWVDTSGILELAFLPKESSLLTLCLSNDDILVPPDNRMDPAPIPLGDLDLLAKGLGYEGPVQVPELKNEVLTGGTGCPQAIRFLGAKQ